MPILSAGLLVYRKGTEGFQVLLIHPGGPFFIKKDKGVWSVPKGEYQAGESSLKAAQREFEEETGNFIANGNFIPLQAVRSKGGKLLQVWAVETDLKEAFIRSNFFELEWPPRSGKKQFFPEADRAEWFSVEEAREKILPYQAPLLDELESMLAG